MKIRTDFVSNSSSSSFIVINYTNKTKPTQIFQYGEYDPLMLPTGEYGGEYSFGLEFEEYRDFWTKLNWCAILIAQMEYYVNMSEEDKAWYMDNEYRKHDYEKRLAYSNEHYEEYKEILKSVCRTELGLCVDVLTYKETDKMFAYIDHQSDIFSNPDNARMFVDESTLSDFLFSMDSYIRTGSDNCDEPPEGWYE